MFRENEMPVNDVKVTANDRILQRQQQKYDALADQYKQERERLAATLAALQAEQEKSQLLQHQIAEKNKQLQQLITWIESLKIDIHSIFNSFTWKSGSLLTQVLLKVLFKKAGTTAKDHIEDTLATITAPPIDIDNKPVLPSIQSVQTSPALPAMGTADYATWIANYDSPTTAQLTRLEKRIEAWENPPLISLIIITDNTPEQALQDILESVSQQLYPHWELCIIDNASTAPHVKILLEEYAAKDIRITCHYQTEQTTQSSIYNSVLNSVTGQFISFMTEEYVLAPTALFWVAEALHNNSDISLCYGDEDKLDQTGQRCEPYFKPDWNPDLFLSSPFIRHLVVYNTALVKKVGSFRAEYDGAQDNDLILRIIDTISPSQIHHIPRVLCHWLDTATPEQKNHHTVMNQKVIQDYLNHHNKMATVTESSLVSGAFQIQYAVPTSAPLVSLLIHSHNDLVSLKNCIQHLIEKTTYNNYEILILVHRSEEPDTTTLTPLLETLATEDKIRIIYHTCATNNTADIYNKAVEQAQGDIIGFLSADTEVINSEWLTEMVSHAIRPEVGLVGARLWYPNDTLHHAGIVIGINKSIGYGHQRFKRDNIGYQGRAALVQNYSAVSGACMVMQKACFIAAGGFNSEHLKSNVYDVDLCLKIQQLNLRVVWTPYAEFYHHTKHLEQDSVEQKMQSEEEKNYLRTHWKQFFKHDPAYNPNLSLNAEDFSYAWPPRVPLY